MASLIKLRCAMGTRFNSFYHEEMHPFVNAMVGFLAESGARASRPGVMQYFMRSAQQKYESDIDLLKKVAREVVAERRACPNDKKNLLNAMLKGIDVKTGEAMTEESIMNNMITFLIAGMLTSPLYLLAPSTTNIPQVTRLLAASCLSSSTILSSIQQRTKPRNARLTKSLDVAQLLWITCRNSRI